MALTIYFASMLGVALEGSAAGLPEHGPLPSAAAANMELRDPFIIPHEENSGRGWKKVMSISPVNRVPHEDTQSSSNWPKMQCLYMALHCAMQT